MKKFKTDNVCTFYFTYFHRIDRCEQKCLNTVWYIHVCGVAPIHRRKRKNVSLQSIIFMYCSEILKKDKIYSTLYQR